MTPVDTSTQLISNEFGGSEEFLVTIYMVDQEDVGKSLDHYLGYQHKSYKLKSSDVGRLIEYRRQGNYTCWFFKGK